MSAATESVAAAFGVARPVGTLVPHSFRSSPTWVLDTPDGRILVKQVVVAGREAEVERAGRFERRAAEAGLDIPRAIPPAGEAVGFATAVDGLGWVRAYEWVDGRDLYPGEDVAAWLGRTMAAIHAIAPADAAERVVYGIHPIEQWRTWLTAGERLGRSWAPVLRDGLDGILAISEWVSAALDRAADYVLTHRDIEPWNVMMTAGGPMLIDWDGVGPDSAGLEACHAAFAFAAFTSAFDAGALADPSVAALTATLSAYAAAGGRLRPDPDLLARRVGMRVNRLGWRLSASIGASPPGGEPLAQIDKRAAEQIQQLPGFAARLRALGDTIATAWPAARTGGGGS